MHRRSALALATLLLPIATLLLARPGAAEDEPPATPAATAEDLAWLAGTWRAETGPMPFEEHWTAPWGGTLVAVSRGLQGQATAMVELSSIAPGEDGLVLSLRHFSARLDGWGREQDGPSRLRLVETGPRRVAFEDPEAAMPRRIEYAREGEVLRAVVSGERDGQPVRLEFSLQRVP